MKPEDFYQQLKGQLNSAMTGSKALNAEAMTYLQAATNNLFENLILSLEKNLTHKKQFLSLETENYST